MKSSGISAFIVIAPLFCVVACHGTFDEKKIRPSLVANAESDSTSSSLAATPSETTAHDLKSTVQVLSQLSDRSNRVAPLRSAYAMRLNTLTRNHINEDGLHLNFKVYLDEKIHIFSMADGSIRVHSGLMDHMNDDELLFLVGHEIGHLRHGHTEEATKGMIPPSGIEKNITEIAPAGPDFKKSTEGRLAESLSVIRFSPSQDQKADEYAIQFMKRHGYSIEGVAISFARLASTSKKGSLIPSHLVTKERAARLARVTDDSLLPQIAEAKDNSEVPSATSQTRQVKSSTGSADENHEKSKETPEKETLTVKKVQTPAKSSSVSYGFSSIQISPTSPKNPPAPQKPRVSQISPVLKKTHDPSLVEYGEQD
jgi:metalloprotease